MSPEDWEQMQYARASTLSVDLDATGEDEYTYQIRDRDGHIHKLRNVADVSEWLDRYEDTQRTG